MAPRKGTKYNDVFFATSAAEAFDALTGYDVLWYNQSLAGVRIDLINASSNTGDAEGDIHVGIESFKLTRFNDQFFGSAGNDVVNGDSGNDRIDGRGGADSLTGHSGNDTINGGDGNDALWGGGNNDVIDGGTGNDLINGDAHDDLLSGGGDNGTVTITNVSKSYYQYSSTILIPLEQIDDFGEWVVVPKRSTIENAGQLTSIGRAGGDAIMVLTNGFDDARNWNAIRLGSGSQPIDLGPGGVVGGDTSIIFNAGPGVSTIQVVGPGLAPPAVKSTGNNAESVVSIVTPTPTAVMFGDTLRGGSGADTFEFAIGDGVDRIMDFAIGVDRIDIATALFDGNRSNGEFHVADYAGGALILFRDSSADGFSDNNAIFLHGLKSAAVDASLFI